jgi:putative transposase
MKNSQIEHIRAGRPSENSFVESFNGKLGEECLNEHWFLNLQDALEKIESWRPSYDEQRLHGSLQNMTPYGGRKI